MRYFCAIIGIITLAACGSAPDVGPQGPKGDTGAQGPSGPQGDSGQNCSVSTVPANAAAPAGGSLIQCPDGSQALVLNGVNGTNGTNGAAGAPGTIVSPIQFCAGTGHYPSTFPEVGFCIANHLYAVYSANDGFLTEVLPGTWQSNAVGSSCTFTVAANCVVTR